MNILDYLKTQNKYKNILDNLKDNQNIYVGNIASNASKYLTSLIFNEKQKNIIYVCENIYEASKAFEVLADILGTDNVSFFPVEEFVSLDLVASSSAFRLARMMSISALVKGKPQVFVTNVEGFCKNTLSKELLDKSIITIKKNDIYNIYELEKDLITRGYKKTGVAETVGTFSKRGSIIDIYPLNETTSVRINFFDDEIETIKLIDLDVQLSKEHIDKVEIYPMYDIYYPENRINDIKERIKKHIKTKDEELDKLLNNIENYNNMEQLSLYLPLIDENYIRFIDLFDEPICIFDEFKKIKEHEIKTLSETKSYLKANKKEFLFNYINNVDEIKKKSNINIYVNNLMPSLHDEFLHALYDFKTSNTVEYHNNLKAVFDNIELNKDKTYILTHMDEAKLAYLEEILNTRGLHYYYLENNDAIREGKINVFTQSNAYGYNDFEENLEILTPHEFASKKIVKNAKYEKFYKQSTKIYTKEDLEIGDYVVHNDYGIAKYCGLKTLELRGFKNDYLLLLYENDSKLYIPVENIYLLEKYIGSKDRIPKLSNIQKNEWMKKKAKIKDKIYDVAKDLIKVQAERELKKGYIYPKDTELQKEFEADFMFTETLDQTKTIEEVKKDMESTKPVDRLICGDVGFGKTEIAMRAAFKAVQESKQVVYLAPTTVLTRQHYYSFKERFEKYGVRVELLNRFVDTKTQKAIIEGLKTGYVDIVIGTHRVLSNEISYHDLGLLIIDEEQRFGVSHKEKIKKLKANVDVLTLTATPIPRTLQMSLTGIRDLSLIETPPVNRLPIQTYVLEYNESVIREAINKELARGGQVFYLLNRIDMLEESLNDLMRLVPNAKFGMIHGRMTKEMIEKELNNFLDNKYNVLLCTTIIETGIDIPNANTLIIEKADILGLSQLYQIRGRVGRSERIAYAYLMYDDDKTITETAQKRLETIKEFTALGSGYKIAMRDLAIRGAGDILGSEQSGYIDAIGMDMYMKLLSETINELKGTVKEEVTLRKYGIDIERHIDPEYVSEESIRIDIHKSISKIRNRDQIDALKEEFTDRYGQLSDKMCLYMEEKYLEFLLKASGVEQFKEMNLLVNFVFDQDKTSKIRLNELKKIIIDQDIKYRFAFENNKIQVKITKADYPDSYIYSLTKFLEAINEVTK